MHLQCSYKCVLNNNHVWRTRNAISTLLDTQTDVHCEHTRVSAVLSQGLIVDTSSIQNSSTYLHTHGARRSAMRTIEEGGEPHLPASPHELSSYQTNTTLRFSTLLVTNLLATIWRARLHAGQASPGFFAMETSLCLVVRVWAPPAASNTRLYMMSKIPCLHLRSRSERPFSYLERAGPATW